MASSSAQESPRWTIVLFGLEGVGKSTFGNALLGKSVEYGSADGFPIRNPRAIARDYSAIEAQAIDGIWLGNDADRKIRVVEISGYDHRGSNEYKAAVAKWRVTELLKQYEKIPTAFILLKSAAMWKNLEEDKRLCNIFQEALAAWGFRKPCCIVITKFSFSESERKRREKAGISLVGMKKEMGLEILRDEDGPIVAIDALHSTDQKQQDEYDKGMGSLWESLTEFLQEQRTSVPEVLLSSSSVTEDLPIVPQESTDKEESDHGASASKEVSSQIAAAVTEGMSTVVQNAIDISISGLLSSWMVVAFTFLLYWAARLYQRLRQRRRRQ